MKGSARVGDNWPQFMLNDPVAENFSDLYARRPEFQFVLVGEDPDEPLALGNSLPLRWDGAPEELPDDGWDWAFLKGFRDLDSGVRPNLLCAIQAVVFHENRGKGLSKYIVEGMRSLAKAEGYAALIAPVRPSRKSDHPDISIDEYVTWTDEDGAPRDPWLRVHHRLGARIIRPCPNAMRIAGSLTDWHGWTGIRFETGGKHIVPGALVAVEVDLEADSAVYVEPNVWMWHKLE